MATLELSATACELRLTSVSVTALDDGTTDELVSVLADELVAASLDDGSVALESAGSFESLGVVANDADSLALALARLVASLCAILSAIDLAIDEATLISIND